jgi:hypothetical protein
VSSVTGWCWISLSAATLGLSHSLLGYNHLTCSRHCRIVAALDSIPQLTECRTTLGNQLLTLAAWFRYNADACVLGSFQATFYLHRCWLSKIDNFLRGVSTPTRYTSKDQVDSVKAQGASASLATCCLNRSGPQEAGLMCADAALLG